MSDEVQIESIEAENRELRAVVFLAQLLIQPSDDGPQLVGSKYHRERLMRAVRRLREGQPFPRS